ncbi:hypothetical protein DIPPA_20344 [Diplonema papillatum]|nr:hypothetical protein DIPPA_20344 [Diplonema papillatum]
MFETPGDIGKFAADLMRKALPAPEKLQPMEHLPSPDGEFTNRVVYLHGFGDTPRALRQMAADLRLPQTDSYFPSAPQPLPLGLDGRGWYTSASILQDVYGPRKASSMEKAEREQAVEFIADLLAPCRATTTFLVGFGQGAELALWVCNRVLVAGVAVVDPPRDLELPASGPTGKLRRTNVFVRSTEPRVAAKVSAAVDPRSFTCSHDTSSLFPLAKWFSRILPMRLAELERRSDVVTTSNGILGD